MKADQNRSDVIQKLLTSEHLSKDKRETLLRDLVNQNRSDVIQELLTSEHLSQDDLKVIGVNAVLTSNLSVLEMVCRSEKKDLDVFFLVMVAIWNSRVEPLVFFAKVGSENIKGFSLCALIHLGEVEHLRSLFDLGTPYHEEFFQTACRKGHLELVKLILERFSSEMDDLTCGLCEALRNKHVDVAGFLSNLNKPGSS